MSTVHRRVLKDSDDRCAGTDCPRKHDCARFTSPMPQGLGTRMGNFAVPGITCSSYLPNMISDDELALQPAKPVKPAIGSKP